MGLDSTNYRMKTPVLNCKIKICEMAISKDDFFLIFLKDLFMGRSNAPIFFIIYRNIICGTFAKDLRQIMTNQKPVLPVLQSVRRTNLAKWAFFGAHANLECSENLPSNQNLYQKLKNCSIRLQTHCRVYSIYEK